MDCIFCKIINKEIPAEIVYEDEEVLCFKDINPSAPVHVLIIPKKHINSIAEVNFEASDIVTHIHKIGVELAKKFGICETGFRLVTNCGEDAGQTVKHLHYHLMGGKKCGNGPLVY